MDIIMHNIKEMIQEYDPSNCVYKAILYVVLSPRRGRRLKSGDLPPIRQCEDNIPPVFRGKYQSSGYIAIMTVHNEYLCFYLLEHGRFIICSKKIIPYNSMFHLNIRKRLFGNKMEFIYFSDDKKWKMNILFYDKVLLIRGQEENAKILKEFFKIKPRNCTEPYHN